MLAELKSKSQVTIPSGVVSEFGLKKVTFLKWWSSMDIWVIWYHEGDRLVALLDIGHHSILKKY